MDRTPCAAGASNPRRANAKGLALLIAFIAALAAGPLAPRADAAITHLGSSTGNTGNGASTVTVNVPAGVQAGDHLTVTFAAEGTTTIPVPAGWTQIYSRTDAPYGYGEGMWHTVGAGDPSSYSFNVSVTRRAVVSMEAWRGVNAADPIDTYQVNGWFGQSTGTAPAIYTSTANEAVLQGVSWGGVVGSTQSGLIDAAFGQSSGSLTTGITTHNAYFIMSSAGYVPAHNFYASWPNDWGSLTLALNPDVTPPAAPTITSSPASPDNDLNPSWSFSGEAGATFQCKIARGATIVSDWAACTSPKSYSLSGQPDGTYTFSVRAIDGAGNVGTAATSNYTLDATAPAAPSITSSPASPGNGLSPSWSFSGEAGATFECQLTRGATIVSDWASCTNPKGYSLSGQPDGTYTFSVRATDAVGNTGSAATSNYVLDTTAPAAPSITSSPSSPGNSLNPSWSFSGEAGATFQCQLTRGATVISAYASCSSPKGYSLSGQPDGTYTFSVKQTDSAGNTGAAATSVYVLDTTAPAAPSITSSPSSPGNGLSPSWSFSGEAGATFQCKIARGATIVSDWATCTSPKSYSLSGQPDGTYTFSVKQTDTAGNTGAAATSNYVLDTTAPAAPSITSSPSSPGNGLSPSWSFSGEAGATFECQLTRGATIVSDWATCTNPKGYSLSGQPDGTYTFSVRATDAVGNTGSAASSDYDLDTTPPAAPTIDSSPGPIGADPLPAWSFSGPGGATFQCRLDRGATQISGWASCSSPKTYDLNGQPDGTYTISVRSRDAAGNVSSAVTDDYQLSTALPSPPTIDARPASPGSDPSPAWAFSSTDPSVTFECRLTRGATTISDWASCSSPQSYDLSGDPDSTYTFSVRAVDTNTSLVSTPTSDDYVLDTSAPAAPSIDSSPSSPATDANPSWSFSGEAGASFECRLTRGATTISDWASCSSPQSYDLSGDPDGTYTFAVRATDAAGNTGPAATDDYAYDTTAPGAPSIDSAPSTPDNQLNPSWSFSGEAGASFECRLTRGATTISDWASCSSPQSYDLSGDPDGTYTFAVRATDAAGNTGPAASSDYDLDTTPPPAPSIDSSPGAAGSSTSPSWSFSSEPGASFECRLDRGATQISGWASCASPKSYDLSSQPDGTYTFSVRAIDAVGNTGSAASDDYTLDTTAPAAPTIQSGPASPSADTSPTWSFSGEAGASFECRLDRGATQVAGWTSCNGSKTYSLSGQPDGTYTFSVRATDAVGNTGPAATDSFDLDATPPAAPIITSSPTSPGNALAPSWSFSGEAGASFECRLTRGGTTVSDWSSCASPQSYDLSGDPDGTYTFAVRATDPVGNTGPAASSDYDLDTTPPAPPTIDSTPGAAGFDTSPTWAFSGPPGTTMECRLDRGGAVISDWVACSSPETYDLSGQPDGTYTFSVRSSDAVGNHSSIQSSDYELITSSPPVPTITSAPASPASGLAPQWSFTGDPTASFECRLQSGATIISDWSGCAGSQAYDLSGQPDGTYTFSVRAVNRAALRSAAATSDYVLDTTPPAAPTLGSSPGPVGSNLTPTWSFSGEPGGTYQCRLLRDGTVVFDWAPCTSPQGYDLTGQPDGNYAFEVREVDAAGNTGPPLSDTYTLLTSSPGAPTILSTPGPQGNSRSPAWSFVGPAGTTLECRLQDGGTMLSDWSSCDSSRNYDLSGQPDANYTFSVRSRNAAGKLSAATTSDYLLDTTPPGRPRITDAPRSPWNDVTPNWSFRADADAALQCRLKREGTTIHSWGSCASPYGADLAGRQDGDYTVAVRAVDSVGNTSSSGSDTYVLDTTPPDAPSIDSGPGSEGSDRSPTWSFSGESGADFECRLDRGGQTVSGWSSCSGSKTYSLGGSSGDQYTFMVRATDQAGNTGQSSQRIYRLSDAGTSSGSSTSAPTGSGSSGSSSTSGSAPSASGHHSGSGAPHLSPGKLQGAGAGQDGAGASTGAAPAQAGDHGSGGGLLHKVVNAARSAATAARKNAGKAVFPVALLLLLFAFVAVQERIDRNDPKLALAPVFADNEVDFEPPPS